jgi:septum formation protein
MLNSLSNSTHEVITAVGFLQKSSLEIIYEVSRVTFGHLTELEIENYVKTQSPLDKAGGYGIQDLFGLQNIFSIQGSYSNIIGLPVAQVFKKIKEIISKN